jgi:leucyl aminopeptidase
MEMIPFSAGLAQADVAAVVVGVHAQQPLSGPAATVDQATDGLISQLIASQDITGKLLEATEVLAPRGLRTPCLLVMGLGPSGDLDAGASFRIGGAAARKLANRQRATVLMALDTPDPRLAEALVAGVCVGCQGQDLYRREKRTFPFGRVGWWRGDPQVCHTGQVLGQNVNLARRLVNEPPQAMYPESFVAQARESCEPLGLEVEVWDEQRLEHERCGALLAVARGSDRAPRLLIVSHRGDLPDRPTLGLVGKGVTFDSGGLSLKPSDAMKAMKSDMAGAATVLAAVRAIAELKLPINVCGLMGLVENMVGPASYKLGDVLTARNGRTIEVHNTDAEGRLVLADVLSVAVDRGATRIVDLATLTGACMVALGTDVAGLMTNDAHWCQTVARAARQCGEAAWELPMFDEYREQIRSDVADIKNTGEGRWAGAITAGKFLQEFVADVPWTHIDIAGPSFLEKPKPWIDAGGSGTMVRTLVELARHHWTGADTP